MLKRDYERFAKHRPSQLQLQTFLTNPDFFKLPLGADSREQSKRIDRILGFKIPKIERKLLKKYKAYYVADKSGRKQRYEGSQTWIGLHPQVLQTPYSEILSFCHILKKLNPETFNPKTIVDIGAGYGRVGIVMSSFFPDASFIGYEIIENRQREGKRIFESLELGQCQMLKEDLSKESFTPPEADLYFIYDFSDPLDIRKILTQIKAANKNRVTRIIAKGEFIQPIIKRKHPEFKSVLAPIAKGGLKRSWDIFELGTLKSV